MDKRQTIGAICLTVALVLGYMWLRSYVDRKYPPPAPGQQASTVTPTPETTNPPATSASSTQPGSTTAPTGPMLRAGWGIAPSTQPATPVTLGSPAANDPTYSIAVSINPRGASVGRVVLNQFKHPADFKKPEKDKRIYVYEETGSELPGYQPLSTKYVKINDGNPIWLGGFDWVLESSDATSAAYSITLTNGEAPALKITKSYRIKPASDASKGYEVAVKSEYQNLSGEPIRVRAGYDGPSLPPRELSRPPDRQLVAGYLNDADKQIEINAHAVEEFSTDKPTIDLTQSKEGRPLGWFGTATVYFTALVEPMHPNWEKAPYTLFAKVTAEQGRLDHKEINPEDRPTTINIETVEIPVAPGGRTETGMNVYFGPRFREVMETAAYGNYPRQYNSMLVIKTGPCWFLTFSWLIDVLVWLLKRFYWLCGGFAGKGDWGLAIILLVCLVRSLLHPITKRSQIQMVKMGKLGPEIEKLKAKHGDDKEALNKAMMAFYKENGAGQILGCLPMFLQMPIWIALYSSLQTTFQLRQAQFLWGFTWIKDLAKPDYLVQFNHPISLIFGWQIEGINILPILLGVVFWLNHKYTPKPVAATPEQQQQQKMMQWMVLLFPVFLYNGPSGLNLYILTSTAIGIIESKIIRDHIKQREEAEKAAGPVIVDAPVTRAAKQQQRNRKSEPEPKKGGIGGWWADMQAKVEEARRQAEKRKE